jgi:hypothetical protein
MQSLGCWFYESNGTMTNKSSFDLDFGYGRKGEQLVDELLTGGLTVEVKRDRKWAKTGNLYIETECYFKKIEGWAPSGLGVTEAAYWAFVLEGSTVIVPTDALRWGVKEFGRPIECNIPPNISKGFLVTVDDLMSATRLYKKAMADELATN